MWSWRRWNTRHGRQRSRRSRSQCSKRRCLRLHHQCCMHRTSMSSPFPNLFEPVDANIFGKCTPTTLAHEVGKHDPCLVAFKSMIVRACRNLALPGQHLVVRRIKQFESISDQLRFRNRIYVIKIDCILCIVWCGGVRVCGCLWGL